MKNLRNLPTGTRPSSKRCRQEAAVVARDALGGLAPIREAEAFSFPKEKSMVVNEVDVSTFRENAVAIQDEIAKERGASELLELIPILDLNIPLTTCSTP